MSEGRCKKSQDAFLALVRAGLWEKANDNENQNENLFEGFDWGEVQKLVEEQSVVGLVAAGAEWFTVHGSRFMIPLTEKLTMLGMCQLIEQRNETINHLIVELWFRLREAGVKVLLVKGQGLAQCYERPLWRSSGDVDFLVDEANYWKAVEILKPVAENSFTGGDYSKEYGFNIGAFLVEVHGSLRTGLSSCIDKEVDVVQKDTFANGRFRVWHNGVTDVLLPDPNDDVFFVFTHFIKHFYKEGMNLRQVCDWCRLLWTYRKEIDVTLLEHRLRKAGLMNEWKAFAALTVDSLGMPVETMPLYDADERWQKKGEAVLRFILKGSKPNKVKDTLAIAKIFPWNTLCFAPSIFLNVNRLKVKERINNNGLLHSYWGWDSQ